MALFKKDGFTFFEGFFKEPVLNLDMVDLEKKIKYIKEKRIKRVSFDSGLERLDFLKEVNFIEEMYVSKLHTNDYSNLYNLKKLKRIIININKSEPHLDYSKFKELEYLSIDWYTKFPDLTKNNGLKELIIWKYKPKSKSFAELKLPISLRSFKITESNIVNFEGLIGVRLKQFEAYHCNALISLDGVSNFGKELEVIILDYCKKLTAYDELGTCKELTKIILGDCGNIQTLKWLAKLKKVKHFSFWNTELIDGDTSPCFGIDYVSFKNRKHYNHPVEDFSRR